MSYRILRLGQKFKLKRSFTLLRSPGSLTLICYPSIFTNVLFARFDAYEMDAIFDHFGVDPAEVSLISIATALHWLDFDKLASKIVQTFPKETVVAVVASPPVQIMNQQLLKHVSWENCENYDSIQDYYEPKLEKYSKLFDAIYYNDLRDYMEFDFESLIKEYFTLPFDNYFRHHKFMKVNFLEKNSLLDLVEYVRSHSFYQLFRCENEGQINNGLVQDPLEVFAREVLKSEKFYGTGLRPGCLSDQSEQMKRIKFDTLWTFFVHILHN